MRGELGREFHMSVSSRVGTALAAGYVLGRFKKLRLALVVGSALANKNVRDSALSFISQGTKGLAASPEAQKIAKQITSELADAGKAAAITAVSGRINQLSDQLGQRSAAMRGEQEEPEEGQGEDEQPEEEGKARSRDRKSRDQEQEPGDESEQGEEPEDEEAGEGPEGEYEEEGEEPEDEGDEASDEYEEGEEEGEEPEDETDEASDEYEDEESEDEDTGDEEDTGEEESDRDEQASRPVPRRQRAASPAARKGA
jgi:hypothetical protein